MNERKHFFDNGKTIFYLSLLFIVSLLIVNEWWLLAWIFSPEKIIISKDYKFIILFFQSNLLICGIYLVKNQERAALIKILKLYLLISGFCFALIVGIVCVDFAVSHHKLSHMFPTSGAHLVDADYKLGWRLKKSIKASISADGEILLETDKKGRRKIDTVVDNDASAIYFFGDSLTFGSEVSNEDVFPYLIATKYLYGKARVCNMGVMAYGVTQMYQAFIDIEDQIRQGDLVIFCPNSHDIIRTYQDFVFLANHILFGKMSAPGFPIFENGVLKTKSMKSFCSMKNRIKIICVNSPVFGKIYVKLFGIKNSLPNSISNANEIFRQIKYRTEQKGAKFALFFLPYLCETRDRKYIVDISNIDHIDLMNDFPDDEKYFKNLYTHGNQGNHYTQEGHRFVAKILMRYLINKKILDYHMVSEKSLNDISD